MYGKAMAGWSVIALVAAVAWAQATADWVRRYGCMFNSGTIVVDGKGDEWA